MARFVSDKERQIIYDKPVFYKPQMSTYCIINFEVVLGIKWSSQSWCKVVIQDLHLMMLLKKIQFGQLIQLLMSAKIISDVVGDLLE